MLAVPADAPFWKVVCAPDATLRMVAFPPLLELLKMRLPVAMTLTWGELADALAMPLLRNW